MVIPNPNNPTNRPGWLESVPWMGLSAGAWWRLFKRHRFQVATRHWPAALFDLAFATGNSLLAVVQSAMFGHELSLAPPPLDPLFVVGHWRTGTTLFHELLTLDPAMRSPSTYECLAPHHFVLTGKWLPRWTRFTLPGTRSFDPMRVAWEAPQEDEFALLMLGLESPYAAIGFPNSAERDDPALELERLPVDEQRRWIAGLHSFLKKLTFVRDGQLLLKSPTHTTRVPILQEMFPAARWVLMTRNPFEVWSSTIKLWRSLYSTYGYQDPDFTGLEQRVVDTFARFHDRWEATCSQIPSEARVVVRYEDLLADPAGTVRRVYDSLQLNLPASLEDDVRKYFADRADYRPNRHAIDPHWAERIRQQCRGYFERHGYRLSDGRPEDRT